MKCEFHCQGKPIFKRYLPESNTSTLPMNRWKQVLRKSAGANKNDKDINENVIEKFLEEYFLHLIFRSLNYCGLTFFQDKTYFYPNVSWTNLFLPKFFRVGIFLTRYIESKKFYTPNSFWDPTFFALNIFWTNNVNLF